MKTYLLINIFIKVAVKCVVADNSFNNLTVKFIDKWLDSSKVYLGLIIPKLDSFYTQDVVKMVKEINTRLRSNKYIMVTNNVTKYRHVRRLDHEISWYPYDFEKYDGRCNFLNSIKDDKLLGHHFLFFTSNVNRTSQNFETCKIRFDSNIAVYYIYNTKMNQSSIKFQEIYKIDENQRNLEKNLLGEIPLDSKELKLSGLNSYIWNRRNTLKGEKFKAVSYPFSTATGLSTSYYYYGIVEQLMRKINFTVDVTVLNRSYNYIAKAIGDGKYDIGTMGFIFTLFRSELVDFSHGVGSTTYVLYYVRSDEETLGYNVFTNPYSADAWVSLSAYIFISITGFVIAALMLKNRVNNPRLDEIFHLIIKGSNMVLRSLITKRQSSEPFVYSTKLAFLSMVSGGFLLFSLYRATLVAFIAVANEGPPIKNLQELITSNYRLAVFKDSALHSIFSQATAGSEEYHLTAAGKLFPYSDYPSKFIERMVMRDPETTNTILLGIFGEFDSMSHIYPCKLSHIQSYHRNNKETEGLIFRKNWPFTSLLNYHLLIMKEKGVVERLKKLYYTKNNKEPCANEHKVRSILKSPKPIGKSNCVFLYLVVFVGILGAMILLMMEKLHTKYLRTERINKYVCKA